MKAKATQLAGLLMMIQTMHLINFDYDWKVRLVQTCKHLTNYKNKWKGFLNQMKLYSTKWLIKKLKDHYSDHLCFAKINGRKMYFVSRTWQIA